MKRIFIISILSALIFTTTIVHAAPPTAIKSDKKETPKVEKKQQKLSETDVKQMVARIEEIKKMDIKSLPAKERKELRREVRTIRDNLNQNADGFSIYIGGGALLVIIILLILLL